MKRHLGIVLAIVLLGGGLWAWVLISKVSRAQSDVEEKFNELVAFYVQETKEHIAPLLTLSGATITATDTEALGEIVLQAERLTTTADTVSRIDILLAVQRRMFGFFSKTGLSEELTSNMHYRHWSREVSGNGTASTLIHEYNQALARYKTSLQNPVAGMVKPWPNTEFLSVNGVTQKDTIITF